MIIFGDVAIRDSLASPLPSANRLPESSGHKKLGRKGSAGVCVAMAKATVGLVAPSRISVGTGCWVGNAYSHQTRTNQRQGQDTFLVGIPGRRRCPVSLDTVVLSWQLCRSAPLGGFAPLQQVAPATDVTQHCMQVPLTALVALFYKKKKSASNGCTVAEAEGPNRRRRLPTVQHDSRRPGSGSFPAACLRPCLVPWQEFPSTCYL